jgi:hypothetical protein
MSAGKYLVIIALILFYALFVYVSWKATLNLKGYCKRTHQYLTDDEKLNIAINKVLASYPPFVGMLIETEDGDYSIGRVKPEQPNMYGSVEELFEVNPGCCKMDIDESGDLFDLLSMKMGVDISRI